MQVVLVALCALISCMHLAPASARSLMPHTESTGGHRVRHSSRPRKTDNKRTLRREGSLPLLEDPQTTAEQDEVPDMPMISDDSEALLVTKEAHLKKESCKTEPLEQVVSRKGCLRTKITNNFCYGQCNSFFIPKPAKRSRVVDAFTPCGFCRPVETEWIAVTLRCPSERGVRYSRTLVQYVRKCQCMAQEVKLVPV